MRCMYCPAELVPTNKTWAHVFPDALGGRLRSDKICCHACNLSFSPIEAICARGLGPVSAMLGALKGDGSLIEVVFEHEGRKCRASGGGMFEEESPPTERGRRWSLPADSDKQVDVVIRALRQRRFPPEALTDGRMAIADSPAEDELPDPDVGVTRPMEWGFAEAKRMQIKVACDLLAHQHPAVARHESFRSACEYARNGNGDWHVPFDSSTEGSGLDEVNAPYRHSIDVWTNRRRVHARLGLFTYLRFVATLVTDWDGPRFRLGYSFNCLDPKEMVVELKEGADGDALVRKTPKVAHAELLVASARLSETMKRLTPNPVYYRADALAQNEMYARVKACYEEKPWPVG